MDFYFLLVWCSARASPSVRPSQYVPTDGTLHKSFFISYKPFVPFVEVHPAGRGTW